MIIGGERYKVIENIKIAAENANFYAKVEVDDPILTIEEKNKILENYFYNRNKKSFKFKSLISRKAANICTSLLNYDTEIIGLEKLKEIKGGAFITSNHFSPIENTCIRKLVRLFGKKRINVICQATNFAMKGIIGYLMNYSDTIPLADDAHHIKEFINVLDELIKKDEYILIYPEQEMWFNYRKPRPPKRGAYYFAAKLKTPVISCFVEIIDKEREDRKNFQKVKYKVHILDVLYPDETKSVRESSNEMCLYDYELKKQAYEAAYNKQLDYNFLYTDIAGWNGERE